MWRTEKRVAWGAGMRRKNHLLLHTQKVLFGVWWTPWGQSRRIMQGSWGTPTRHASKFWPYLESSVITVVQCILMTEKESLFFSIIFLSYFLRKLKRMVCLGILLHEYRSLDLRSKTFKLLLLYSRWLSLLKIQLFQNIVNLLAINWNWHFGFFFFFFAFLFFI